MSEPNDRDCAVAADILSQCAKGLVDAEKAYHIIAAYREEIEAKKTVPMAMLVAIGENAYRRTEGGSPWLADFKSLAASFGYEVTE